MMSFGVALPAFASPGPALFRTPALAAMDPQLCLEVAVEAERAGFESLWVPDHLMIGRDDDVLEGWTLLSAVASRTRHARLGLIQQSNLFRSPGPSARAISTLNALSEGRFTYFCGPGGKPENDLFGVADGLDDTARAERLAEAVAVMHALWSGEPVHHRGRHYRLEGARAPAIVAPPLWFASLRPDTLAALAPIAAGWCTPPVSPEEAERRFRVVAEALEDAGRPRDAIELAVETQILVAEDLDDLRDRLREMASLASGDPSRRAPLDPEALDAFVSGRTDEIPAALTERWLVGTPSQVTQRIQDYRRAGANHFILWFMDLPRRDGLRCFVERVRPLLDA